MKSVSVIIPLYNKRPYLDDCFESLLNQSTKPYEIIVADDGSTDGSFESACAFSSRFEALGIKFHALALEHGGVPRALGAAHEKATGDYLTRVDADDMVHPLWLETMLAQDKAHKHVDIRCQNTHIPESSSYPSLLESLSRPAKENETLNWGVIESGNTLYERMFAQLDTSLMTTCGQLYVRQEIDSTHLVPRPELTHTEDLAFNAQLFAHGNPVIVLEDVLYYYRQVSSSLSHAQTSLFETVTKLDAFLQTLQDHPATSRIARAHKHDSDRYLCWYYAIALLEEERLRDESVPFSERVEDARAVTSIDAVFSRAEQTDHVPTLARMLYALLTQKQYAQLQLAARTINIGRSLRRRFKTR